jgi:hypothetical protein
MGIACLNLVTMEAPYLTIGFHSYPQKAGMFFIAARLFFAPNGHFICRIETLLCSLFFVKDKRGFFTQLKSHYLCPL